MFDVFTSKQPCRGVRLHGAWPPQSFRQRLKASASNWLIGLTMVQNGFNMVENIVIKKIKLWPMNNFSSTYEKHVNHLKDSKIIGP